MPKVRCGGCKSYVNRDDIYRKNGMLSVCSPKCLAALRTGHPAGQEKSNILKFKAPKLKRVDVAAVSPAMYDEIMRRDRKRCRFCGSRNNLHVHHVLYRSQGGPGENWNLITLCAIHHNIVHSNKSKYMPLCRGVIWMTYMGPHRQITIPQLQRWKEANGVQL